MNTDNSSITKPEGPGSGMVRVPGIVALFFYLTGLSALLLYILTALWPGTSADGVANLAPGDSSQPGAALHSLNVVLFGMHWQMSGEVRLLCLVIVAGALGSLIHALRSAYWYVGNRNLVRSWIPKYITLPFCGATLAVLFYLIVRAGFFSPDSGTAQTSAIGFCAFAALVGLFCEMAVLKLKQVAETLFLASEHGKDHTQVTPDKPPQAKDKPTPSQ